MIYNDPNHSHYGPVRRLHLKLMELFPDNLSDVEQEYQASLGRDWTEIAASSLRLGLREAYVARQVISRMIGCFDTIHCRITCDTVAQSRS